MPDLGRSSKKAYCSARLALRLNWSKKSQRLPAAMWAKRWWLCLSHCHKLTSNSGRWWKILRLSKNYTEIKTSRECWDSQRLARGKHRCSRKLSHQRQSNSSNRLRSRLYWTKLALQCSLSKWRQKMSCRDRYKLRLAHVKLWHLSRTEYAWTKRETQHRKTAEAVWHSSSTRLYPPKLSNQNWWR